MRTAVRGNQLIMVVDPKKVTIKDETGIKKEDYEIADDDTIVLRLVGREYAYSYKPWVDDTGSKLIAQDNGRLENGIYGLELLIRTAAGVKLRAMHRAVIKIVESNNDTGVDTSDLTETIELEAELLSDGSVINVYESGGQSDWEEADTTSAAYIKNKPSIKAGSGNGSIVEGELSNNTADGKYAHAEGAYTIASGDYQHVQGRYNVEDTAGEYADIVGGGTSESDRRNISTLDWLGNQVLTGKCTAETFVNAEGAEVLYDSQYATEQEILSLF